MIPISDPVKSIDIEELSSRIEKVTKSGKYILGEEVEKFEKALAKYIGTKYAVGVASGSDALYLSLRALDIGPGDQVITTPLTFIATSEAIRRAGATPVFVDIDPESLLIDTTKINAKITSRTKAVLPVHLYGNPIHISFLRKITDRPGLFIIEDCAQSFGSSSLDKKTGSYGTVGCFSFFPAKTLGCLGDGGAITMNSFELYEKIKSLRQHGTPYKNKKHQSYSIGINSRLDAIQACVLNYRLEHIDEYIIERELIAKHYNYELSCLKGLLDFPILPDEEKNLFRYVPNYYTLITGERVSRVDLSNYLLEKGVGNAIYYPIPLHLQASNSDLSYYYGDFPVAEAKANKVLSLPMYPGLTEKEIEHIAQVVKGFFK